MGCGRETQEAHPGMGRSSKGFGSRGLRLKVIGGAFVFVVLLLSWCSSASDLHAEQIEQEVTQEVQEAVLPPPAVWTGPDAASQPETQREVGTRRSRRRTTTVSTKKRGASKETSQAGLAALLLAAAVMAVCGATRWVQADNLDMAARSAAAARSEELQESLSVYEQKMRESAELAQVLAEKKAEAAKQQAQLQAAAKEVEQAERELVEQLTKQAEEGADFGGVVGTLVREAESLEEETKVLQEKLEAMSGLEVTKHVSEHSLVTMVYEEQRQLAVKKREVLDKMAALALLEAKWGDDLKAQGGDILDAIERTTKEIQDLEIKKKQLQTENVASSQLAQSKLAAKDALVKELRDLQTKLDERVAANAVEDAKLKEQKDAIEQKQKELEHLKAEVEKAKAEKDQLVEQFEAKRRAFLEALAPLEEKVAARERDPACAGGICRVTEDKLTKKRDEIVCKGLVCEALAKHKQLEERQLELASQAAAPKIKELQAEISQLKEQLAKGGLIDQEESILKQRLDLLEKDVATAVKTALNEATCAEGDLFLTLEARMATKHSAALGIVNYFDTLMDDDPHNEFLGQKFLRAQKAYEETRLEMMVMLDKAIALASEKSFGKEIKRLYKDGRSNNGLIEEEKSRLEDELAQTKERRKISEKRRELARRGLLAIQADNTLVDPTDTPAIILKRRLLYEKTLLAFYEKKLARLEEELNDFSIKYMDKLADAKAAWLEIKSEYTTSDARWHAAGASKKALNFSSAEEENLVDMEDFSEWSEKDETAEASLASYPDDPKVSDEKLLGITEPTKLSINELLIKSREAAAAARTGDAEGEEEGEEEKEASTDEEEEDADDDGDTE